MEKKRELINKYLLRKKEEVLVDLFIKNYDKSNFYIALVFNSRIKKYKVLFIPLDVVDDNGIDDYCCYQFIMISTVNYLLETIKEEKRCNRKSFRNKLSSTLNSYYIEINTNINKKSYKYLTNQYIPKEWDFLFDVVVTLFEHCPNIVSELANKLLVDFYSKDNVVKYDYSLEMDIFNDNLGMIEENTFDNVLFLEQVFDKYYAVIDDKVFILEYNDYKKILNIYCNSKGEINVKYLYSIISAIRNKYENKFYRIVMIEDEIKTNYLCCGVNDESFEIIKNNEIKYLSLSLLKDGYIKLDNCDKKIIEQVRNILNKNMSLEEVNKIIGY